MTLLFLTSRSWISAVIRWFTEGKASHVAIGMELHGVPILMHADVGGVQVSLRSKVLQGHSIVAEYECLTIPETHIYGAVACLGERYDYVGLFGYALVIAARHIGKRVKNPFASPRAMVCSEFVLSLDRTGEFVPPWAFLDPEQTTPEDLLGICRGRIDLFTQL
jgi:hypothetical protein